MKTYQYNSEVRGHELDSFGHVNNAVYLNYCEQARWKIMQEHNLAAYFAATGNFIVITRCDIKYKSELLMYEQFHVSTMLTRQPPYLVFTHDIMNLTRECKSAKAVFFTLMLGSDRHPIDMPYELFGI